MEHSLFYLKYESGEGGTYQTEERFEVEKVNERICKAKIKLDGKTCVSLIQVCAPTHWTQM